MIFAPIQEQERELREKLDHRIDAYEVEIRALQQLTSLESHMGFRTFVKAIEGRCTQTDGLLRAAKGTDSEMRTIQGRAQAYHEILDICRNGQKQLDRLAPLLKEAQDQKAHAVLPDGKVIPPRSI